jgi:diaminopimelate dehydrogenase
MKKIRAAVVGYGNIGQYVVEALEAAPDFEIAGIVRRSGAENKPAELEAYAVVKDIKELKIEFVTRKMQEQEEEK